ncbi:MAG: molybdopterin-dependent oxidoreductase [Pelotomaculum sp.]|jgi:DMSO/TMAO reductase YedYZ molybdopterin-dependent catalytic subunit|nr:molybdopterin-dependent oxidoreductase [Bacillota bacterium]
MKKVIYYMGLILAVLCLVTGCNGANTTDFPAQGVTPSQTEAVKEGNNNNNDSNDVANVAVDSNMGEVELEDIVGETTPAISGNNQSDSGQTAAPETKTTEKAILIKGSGVAKEVTVTLSQLQAMTDQVAGYTYFSRGKEPKTAYNTYKGVKLSNLISLAGLKEDAQKVLVTGADGYTASFSLIDVKAMLMDETDTSKSLPMLIAYAEDGKLLDFAGGCSFRLVMGQKCEGDYNRQYWVRDVCTIVVQ